MKNLILCVVALVVGALLCDSAQAGPFGVFGRNRGGGGNMNASAGNGLCNMAKQSSVRPSQVINGDFGIKPEPVAPVAPDRVTTRAKTAKVASRQPQRLDFNVFDSNPRTVRTVATR